MARHNEIIMYGQVMEVPHQLYSTKDADDPDRMLVRTFGRILVLRGIRDFGAVDKRLRGDIPIILSQNRYVMAQMCGWDVGDMVFIKGTLATSDTTKAVRCPYCQQIDRVNITLCFINPIFVKKEGKQLTPEFGYKDIRRNAEISNHITVIGKVCNEPYLHVTDKGQRIMNYQLDIERKYRIKEDSESNRHDFPFVKSYGKIADEDASCIKKDGLVFIDGAIQTREYTQVHECPCCGERYEYRNTATEIVPYSTEYLTGCLTMAEAQAEREAKEEAARIEIEKRVFG